MDDDIAGVRVKRVLEEGTGLNGEEGLVDFDNTEKSKWQKVVDLEIVEVAGEIKALPGSISHGPVSIDPARRIDRKST